MLHFKNESGISQHKSGIQTIATTLHVSMMGSVLPITEQTFWNIQKTDPSGRALALYLFYVQAGLKQNSSQPLASDQFCKNGLCWGSLNTVISARKNLIKAGLIQHIRKQSYHYIRIHYLQGQMTNKRFELSIEPIPGSVMGTTGVFDFYSRWWERLTGCMDEFLKRLKKEMDVSEKPEMDAAYYHLNKVYDRMNATGWGIMEVDTELRFWYYLIKSVTVEFERERRHQMKAA